MRNIAELLKELIPPPDYQHRNGFSNEHIILTLSDIEKIKIERALIEMLNENDDTLIGETLAILKSSASLAILHKRLELAKKPDLRIMWASYIDVIKNGDGNMINIALKEFDNITEKYSRITVFHYLAQFNDSRIKEKVKTYINDPDYLTAYNARTSLGIDTEEIIEREKTKIKHTWWKFLKI